MKIIIAGIGKLGEYLTKKLVEQGHSVTIIDNKVFSNKDIVNNEDVFYIKGNSLDSSILLEAGIDKAELLISVMDKDEKNVMCCLLGKKLGVERTIARVRSPEYTSSVSILKDELGLSMIINPEYMTALHIVRVLSIPEAIDTKTFFKGRIMMITIKIKKDSPIIGETILKISKKTERVIVCALERDGNTIIPKGNVKIKENDKLHITGTRENLVLFLEYIGIVVKKPKKIMISGGSPTAVYMAKMLINMGMFVKIIELNPIRCEELSEQLPKAMIINGDVSNQELLYEEEIEKYDCFISLNNIDEENIVHSIFAKSINVPTVITKVNHINLDGVVEMSGIDRIITPHKIATNQIVNYIMALANSNNSSCETIYKFDNEKFEILEFNVKNGFKFLNTKIKDMKIKDGILIVAILRGKNIIFPTGDDHIEENDTIVIAVDENDEIKELSGIME